MVRNKRRDATAKRELGGVSMLTVMFFVLFLSILAVSFLRIANDERKRTISNELSTAALSAAEAGIEDAKRVLLYCASHPTDLDCKFVDSRSCTMIINNFNDVAGDGIKEKEIITKVGNGDNAEAIVDAVTSSLDHNVTYQQYYTCLIVNRYTSDVEYDLTSLDSKGSSESASVVIPLSLAAKTGDDSNPYTTNDIRLREFTVQWHLVGGNTGGDNSYDGNLGALLSTADVNNPQKSVWQGPAMLRVEIVGLKKGGFTLQQLDDSAFTVILRPTIDGSSYEISDDDTVIPLNLTKFADSSDPGNTDNNVVTSPIENVSCKKDNAYGSGYQCQVRIRIQTDMNLKRFRDNDAYKAYAEPELHLNKYEYYLRLTSLYRGTHVNIGNLIGGSAGETRDLVFNGLQPTVDVTGRVSSTYRRLIARVAPNSSLTGDLFFPEYAIESGTLVCKNITVDTVTSGQSAFGCPE